MLKRDAARIALHDQPRSPARPFLDHFRIFGGYKPVPCRRGGKWISAGEVMERRPLSELPVDSLSVGAMTSGSSTGSGGLVN